MLELKTLAVDNDTPCQVWTNGPVFMTGSWTGNARYVVLQGELPQRDADIYLRSPFDYKNQGKSYGCRQNAVEDYQFSGSITSVPKSLSGLSLWPYADVKPADSVYRIISSAPVYSDGRPAEPIYVLLGELEHFVVFETPRLGDGVSAAYYIDAVDVSVGNRILRVPFYLDIRVKSVRPDGKPYTGNTYYTGTMKVGKWGSYADRDHTSASWLSTTAVLSQTLVKTRYTAECPHVSSRVEVTNWIIEFTKEIATLAKSWIQANFPVPSSSYFNRRDFRTINAAIGSLVWDSNTMSLELLKQFIDNLLFDSYWTADELSLLGHQLVENYNAFSSNMLAYLGDLAKVGDTVRTIARLPRDLKNPKAWASAWLSGRYGDRLFVSDTKELFESFAREVTRLSGLIPSRARREKTVTSGPFTIQIRRVSSIYVFDDSFNGVMTGINNLMRWDLWPTLENTWDLVPLSFVVDWVLPVQDLLGQIDSAVQAPYLRVKTAMTSDHRLLSGTLLTTGCIASLDVEFYRRWAHNALADIRPFTVEFEPPSFSAVHAGDALALLVQFRR